jgi:hypothetical protein
VCLLKLRKMSKSNTQKFYDRNPKAKAKKLAYDKAYQKKNRKKANKKKAECTAFRRANGTYGDGSEMDCSHRGGSLVMENRRINRARGGAQRR